MPELPDKQFFTLGRLALISALRANSDMGERVRHWYEFGPGIRERYSELPINCPLVRIIPDQVPFETNTNVLDEVNQDIEIYVATDAPDAAECEFIAACVIDVVRRARRRGPEEPEDLLGLASIGLSSVRLRGIQFEAIQDVEDARIRWRCAIMVRLHWFRRML
jgi:hypothetical protein